MGGWKSAVSERSDGRATAGAELCKIRILLLSAEGGLAAAFEGCSARRGTGTACVHSELYLLPEHFILKCTSGGQRVRSLRQNPAHAGRHAFCRSAHARIGRIAVNEFENALAWRRF